MSNNFTDEFGGSLEPTKQNLFCCLSLSFSVVLLLGCNYSIDITDYRRHQKWSDFHTKKYSVIYQRTF